MQVEKQKEQKSSCSPHSFVGACPSLSHPNLPAFLFIPLHTSPLPLNISATFFFPSKTSTELVVFLRINSMEQELADGEFWLPQEFLNDEDILMDFATGKPNSGGLNKATSGFYSYSNLSSPVESVMGSTETESDEEDYLNGLTLKLANTTIHDDFLKLDANSKSTRGISGSTQSTLCGCTHGSSRGSPNCPSPPAAEAHRNQTSRALLYAAAGELARMMMVEEAASHYYNPNKNYPSPSPHPPRKIGNPNLHYQQRQVAQKLKQQQIAKQQYLQLMLQSRARNGSVNSRPLSSWPTSQQPSQRPPGSGMRAVILGNPTTKRESTGTGVFLPRQSGAPTDPFKKRGCSTVLLPDRVVQALNLNLEAMEGESKLQSRCNGGSYVSDYDVETMYRQSVLMAQQRRNNHRQQPPAMSEFRLPQEWTY
ncbi:hypothetical protein L1987_29439 [Smallanthus sonchifolius]|uniref:Uncharacterized protein n=1 Tax=Smallanthus sonchifolius TaxID=185202 RepID=A0ACB9I1T5_9ASTR|nr:hypothetical protein L1987_29439 [Smallanthus sonchifolius]